MKGLQREQRSDEQGLRVELTWREPWGLYLFLFLLFLGPSLGLLAMEGSFLREILAGDTGAAVTALVVAPIAGLMLYGCYVLAALSANRHVIQMRVGPARENARRKVAYLAKYGPMPLPKKPIVVFESLQRFDVNHKVTTGKGGGNRYELVATDETGRTESIDVFTDAERARGLASVLQEELGRLRDDPKPSRHQA